MNSAVIITSGRLVDPELQAEFGAIPPAFLPIANRRLFELQVESLREYFDQLAMTLPQDYEISERDAVWLQQNKVQIILVSSELSLKESILLALSQLNLDAGCVAINHGDTLFEGISLPSGKDVYSVNHSEYPYLWAFFDESPDGNIVKVSLKEELTKISGKEVLSGFFQFTDFQHFITCLALSPNFSAALDRYVAKTTVHPIRPKSWLDFGHVQSYFHSRSRMTTERAFNKISVEGRILTKRSSLSSKLHAESNWYTSIPNSIRAFTPQYLGEPDGNPRNGYSLEFLNTPSLADLYVFGRMSQLTWDKIFGDCAVFLDACRLEKPDRSFSMPSSSGLYGDKVSLRLAKFSNESSIDLDSKWRYNGETVPSINEIVHDLGQIINESTSPEVSLIHGDLCFSNILFDSRGGHIRVIDPRGEDAFGNFNIFGDQRYDLAKLHHSAIGLYDFIIAGHLQAKSPSPYELEFQIHDKLQNVNVQNSYRELQTRFYPDQERVIAAISCSLFFSMLPLHSEDEQRQTSLLANAFRLYKELV